MQVFQLKRGDDPDKFAIEAVSQLIEEGMHPDAAFRKVVLESPHLIAPTRAERKRAN